MIIMAMTVRVSVMRVIMSATLPAPPEPKRQCGRYQYLNNRFHWMPPDVPLGLSAPEILMIMFVSIVIMIVVIMVIAAADEAEGQCNGN